MQYLRSAVLATLLLASLAVRADDEHIALVKNVSGPVEVLRQGQTLPAAAGMRLFVADRVVSGAGASAGMAFRDGTLLTLGASADIALRAYVFKPKDAQYAFDAYLAKGSAIYASGKIAKMAPEAVKVGTPTATVGVRGTRFLIQAE